MDKFNPYVFVETSERFPSSIATAGWVANQMKYIDLSFEDDLTKVKDIVRSHFAANQGKCHLYGSVTGYRFVSSETESILLHTDGEVRRNESGQFWPRSISIQADPVSV
jgi:hypothetical protein